MSETQVSVSVPVGTNALAQGLVKLLVAVVAEHKAAAGSTLVELSADVTEAVKDLGPALASVGLLSDELKTDAIGVAEALGLAGFEAARQLTATVKA